MFCEIKKLPGGVPCLYELCLQLHAKTASASQIMNKLEQRKDK